MMLRLGFDAKWKLIILCVSIVRYHVIRDGKDVGLIVPSRGLRQRDHLSPYLFILCAEGLSALTRKNELAGLIHGVKVAKRLPLYLIYSSRMIVFCFSKLTKVKLI